MAGKKKKLEFEVDENNCFICTSHVNETRGYMQIHFNNKPKYIHRFIYEECFGEVPPGMVVRHKCDNRKCINPERLEIGTPAQNSNDMVVRNRSLKGSSQNMAKLKEEQVREIFQLLKTEKVVNIARKYNVKPVTITHIKVGRTWNHLRSGKDDEGTMVKLAKTSD